MRMNPRRATLMSAILLAVCTSAGYTAPTAAADGRIASAQEGARESDNVMADPGDAPLQLTAETILRSPAGTTGASRGKNATGSQDEAALAQLSPAPGGRLIEWVAVEKHLLDDLRGGFDTSLHLTLSFGIERAVYLNGALVTTTSFNLPAMRGMGMDEAGGAAGMVTAGVPSSSIALLQNGPGNSFSAGATGAPLAGTVIQNTLNNQSIQSLTTINASANSLELLRANAFQNLLHDGISHAVTPH